MDVLIYSAGPGEMPYAQLWDMSYVFMDGPFEFAVEATIPPEVRTLNPDAIKEAVAREFSRFHELFREHLREKFWGVPKDHMLYLWFRLPATIQSKDESHAAVHCYFSTWVGKPLKLYQEFVEALPKLDKFTWDGTQQLPSQSWWRATL